MTQWTPAAREELNCYLDQVREALLNSGADAGEVIEDLRRHVEEEAATAGLPIVSAEDVRRWVSQLGPVPAMSGTAATEPPPVLPAANPHPRAPALKPGGILLLLGVVLPAVALLIELFTGMCASAFFDPMPTWLHVLLIALVPTVNTATWRALQQPVVPHLRWLGWLNGIALGVAVFYSVLYSPLMLPGFIAVIYFGLGLLPWAPLLSLVATLGLRRHLRHRAQTHTGRPLPGLLRAAALGVLAVALIDGRVWVTRWALGKAASAEPREQRVGLSWLRTLGDRDLLLRECYGRTRRAADFDVYSWMFAGGRRVNAEDARRIYYRVTGRPFNSVQPPTIRTGRGRALDLSDWTWDEDQGGEQVGGRVAGLSLTSSRLDAVIDAEGAVGYVEWMLEFRNVAGREREARAQIQLPPGGVVSRLTLWVNGEEREAAYSGRAKVRQAYQQIAIVQRRDPVLVTTCGPDRVLLQCFPVLPNGGTMKVRVGISAPLDLLRAEEGVLRWPVFVERNFTVPMSLQHALWAESGGRLSTDTDGLIADESGEHPYCLRGRVQESELRRQGCAVRVQRSSADQRAVAALEREGEAYQVLQEIRREFHTPGRPLVVVVDGSRGMKAHLTQVIAALGKLTQSGPLTVFHAGDKTTRIDADSERALRRGLLSQTYAGGLDNVEALVQALETAHGERSGDVLWLHLPKPVVFDSLWPLIQSYERRPNGPELHVFAVEGGPNRVLERLNGVARVSQIARTGSVDKDLEQWWKTYVGAEPCWTFERQVIDPGSAVPSAPRVSAHVVRLWARDEVRRLKAQARTEEAVDLAHKFQLVTGVSGAVVLETDQQYVATGLSPASRDSVPSISTPDTGATWLLLLTAWGVLVLVARRKTVSRTGQPR